MRIPSEDLYAFNIDKQIEIYFRNIGYDVRVVDKPTRHEEYKMGFDTLFRDSGSLKYFALQHKRPSGLNTLGTAFKLTDNHQYSILSRNQDWMFYSFPLFVEYSLIPDALHHLSIAKANFWKRSTSIINILVNTRAVFNNSGQIYSLDTYSWGEFAYKFITCRVGKIERNKSLVKGLLIEEYPLDFYTSYIYDLKNKKLLIVRKYRSENDDR